MEANPHQPPRIPVIAPVWFGAAFLVGLGLGAWQPMTWREAPTKTGLAFGLLALGVLFAGGALGRLRAARTAVLPHHPTTTLLTDGVFARSRNPIYLGLAFLYASVCLFLDIWGPLLTLPFAIAAIHRWVIRPEERALEAAFGDEYRAYCLRTRRWM